MSFFLNNQYSNPQKNPSINNPNANNIYGTPNTYPNVNVGYNTNPQQQQYGYIPQQQQQYGGYGGQQQGGDSWGNQQYGGAGWNQQYYTQTQTQPIIQTQPQQTYGGKWQKWQQTPPTPNNNTWQQQSQPQQQTPIKNSQFETWKQKPQPQQSNSITTSITTPITRTYNKQQSNNENSNLYPDLPAQPEVKFQMGWVEEQPKNVIKQGTTTYISQIGNSAVANTGNQGNSGNLWDEVAQNFNLGFGAQNFINIQNQKPNYGNFINNNPKTQPQSSNFTTQNFFFTLNPIFDQKKICQDFPSPYIKYKIIPFLDQKKALDVCSSSDTKKGLKKNNLTIWDYHGGPNQLFYIKKQPDGFCYIINVARGFALQVPNTTNQQTPMIANPMYGNLQQKWKLQPSTHGCYGIISKATSKALDLYHQRSDNGTPVIQWKYTESANQKWRIVPA